MFKSARIKLTAYYLLIIMAISGLFSTAVYRGLTSEVARGMRFQALRILPPGNNQEGKQSDGDEPRDIIFFGIPFPSDLHSFPPNFHKQIFDEAKRRIALQLILINAGILIISGASGYFLAGKTLKPIAEMVDKQKRFVSDASHELRTPLTSIKTEIEVALRSRKLNRKEARNILASNLEEVDKLKSLTDYFLSLSKYDDPNPKLTFERISVGRLIKESYIKLKPLAVEKKIKMIFKKNDIFIYANKTSLAELITILLDNAIKYSLPKGKIIVSVGWYNSRAIITVKDNGIGIKKEDLPFIFNRFYRAESSRSKNIAKGYGLGLSIAKRIVDFHKGTISVKSVYGKGSSFTVLLPKKVNLFS